MHIIHIPPRHGTYSGESSTVASSIAFGFRRTLYLGWTCALLMQAQQQVKFIAIHLVHSFTLSPHYRFIFTSVERLVDTIHSTLNRIYLEGLIFSTVLITYLQTLLTCIWCQYSHPLAELSLDLAGLQVSNIHQYFGVTYKACFPEKFWVKYRWFCQYFVPKTIETPRSKIT